MTGPTRNGWHEAGRWPQNQPRVPDQAVILGGYVAMSGEVCTTFYALKGKLYGVGDWPGDRPHKITGYQLEKLRAFLGTEKLKTLTEESRG